MRLLFDQNLSFKLCNQLDALFPDSTQARSIGMDRSDDVDLWEYARTNGYVIVTHDVDFVNRSAVHGFPTKIIWLRCGNQPTAYIEALLRNNYDAIKAFETDQDIAVLEIF